MPSTRSHILTSIMILSCAGCWTPQHGDAEWQEIAKTRSALASPAPSDLPEGLWRSPAADPDVPLRTRARPRQGDELVYALDLETPDSSSRRYLRLTVGKAKEGEPPRQSMTYTATLADGKESSFRRSSTVLPVLIELLDVDGQRIGDGDSSDAFVDFLARGFFATSQLVELERVKNVDEALRGDTILVSFEMMAPPLFAVAGFLQENSVARSLAFELVDTSLLLTVLWNFGGDFSMQPDYAASTPLDACPVTGEPAYQVPVQFTYNDHVAMRLLAVVVDPNFPLGLGAGVTRVDGFRASDDRYRFRFEYQPRR